MQYDLIKYNEEKILPFKWRRAEKRFFFFSSLVFISITILANIYLILVEYGEKSIWGYMFVINIFIFPATIPIVVLFFVSVRRYHPLMWLVHYPFVASLAVEFYSNRTYWNL